MHDGISKQGQTDGQNGAEGRARHNQTQVKTGIQLISVPYALRVMNVYIMDIALKKNRIFVLISVIR